MNNELEQAFDEAVKKYFSEITKIYSCNFKKVDEREFHIISDKYTIKIMLSVAHIPDVVVTLQPNRKAFKGIRSEMFGLEFIVNVCFPDIDLGPIKVKNRQDIFYSIEKQSQALLKCCKKMLDGDFSDWPRFRKILDQKLKN